MPEFLTFGEPLAVYSSEEMDKPLEEVTKFRRFSAGAELNVAIGVARMGFNSSYVSSIGKDFTGNFIKHELATNHVDTSYLFQKEHSYTGFYFKTRVSHGDPQIAYFRAGSSVNQITESDIDSIDLTGLKVLHITGISLALSENAYRAALSLISKAHHMGAIVTFDPNIRKQLWQSEKTMIATINEVASLADVVFPGLKEGQKLTGYSNPQSIANYYLAGSYTKLVILKNGTIGAVAFDDKQRTVSVPALQVDKVVDTVGAGDGFATGIISGLLDHLSLEDCLRRATTIGALAVQSEGDNTGYPDRNNLLSLMEKKPV
ncbi:sugar kinase [Secundilactobacillus collinoides]|uniref:2-keto-3-deoxygluconate kinase n=2 Tax=Secundilactobacillus collinoides TaxID=33960 RepID=A0A0R2BFJ1_SECCO|nr:sugar kinase [Secundilactobacillus collinoides]KRM74870.1 2-keto-3-deoxygluconate kinase [Secundilactobacillus collinoides DSM 20515 = JCM 1123]KZL39366.1 hypothetical protein TY91_10195 [Secundilactobacillus collinoides]